MFSGLSVSLCLFVYQLDCLKSSGDILMKFLEGQGMAQWPSDYILVAIRGSRPYL